MIKQRIVVFVVFIISIICSKDCKASGEGCEKGWHRFLRKCYYVNNNVVNYGEMEKICAQMNATMLSIHSDLENDFIRSITWKRQYYWLGARRVHQGHPQFRWNDGSSFYYQKWWGKEPDQTNDPKATCTSIFTGDVVEWFDDVCDIKRYQICQKSAKRINRFDELKLSGLNTDLNKLVENVGKSTIANIENHIKKLETKINDAMKLFDDKVDDIYLDISSIAKAFENVFFNFEVDNFKPTTGGRIVGGRDSKPMISEFDDIAYRSCFAVKNKSGQNVVKCYYFEKFKVTLSEAEEKCKSFDSALVTISDESENNYVKRKLLFSEDYWTAGVRIFPNTRLFSWSNGDYFQFTNWATNEPKTNVLNANCISIRNGDWFTNDCNEKFSFICEKVKAPKSYFINGTGSALIHRHSIELNAAKNNITQISEGLKRLKARDAQLVKVMNDVIDGSLFVGNFDGKRENDSKTETRKRHKRSIQLIRSERLQSQNNKSNNINILIFIVIFQNITFIATVFLAIFLKKKNFF